MRDDRNIDFRFLTERTGTDSFATERSLYANERFLQ